MRPPPVVIERPDLFDLADARAGRMGAVVQATPPHIWTFVKGTFRGPWADPGSPFRTQVIDPQGLLVAARVTYWTGDVNGLPHWLNPWAGDALSDWRLGGEFLAETLARLPLMDRNILTHSHGVQVGAFAAALVPVNRFVSICGPVREDMAPVYTAAVAHTTRFVQVFAQDFDWTAWVGTWFSGRPALYSGSLPGAHVNLGLAGIGHSTLLYDAAAYPLWFTHGLLL